MGKIKRSFIESQTIQTRWGGGNLIKISQTHFATINRLEVYIIDSTSGNTAGILAPNDEADDPVFDVAVDPLLRFAVTSHESMLMKFWTCLDSKWSIYKQWKFPGKSQPSLILDPSSQKFACLTSNGACYFYNVQNQRQIGKAQSVTGQITAKTFDAKGQLWVGTNLGRIGIINPETLQSILYSEKENAHAQQVTGIADVGDYVFTASLDEVVFVYNKEGAKFVKMIPVQFPIYKMINDPTQTCSCFCATSDGIKRVFIDNGRSNIRILDKAIATQLIYFERLYQCDENGVLQSVDLGEEMEQRAIQLSLHSVYDAAHDSLTDVTCIATSSFSIFAHHNANTHLLIGHENIPLCLSTYQGMLLSGGKDNTARLWDLETFKLLCTLQGHQEAVTAVSFVPKTSYVVTASSDHTLKMWYPNASEDILRSALCTVVAHQKDINAIDVSADGSIVATASRDKTCKLYKIDGESLVYVRTLIGHTSALWTVAFSPVDKIVATGSRDLTIRLWSVDNGACIANFTEFSASVLRLRFATAGLQIIATQGDGIFKVIRTKSGAVDFTSPELHKESIWGLAVAEDGKKVITGSEEGKLIIWDDNTEELEREEMEHKAEVSEAEQELNNALRNGEFVRALTIALKLRMPAKLRTIIRMATEQGASDAIEEYFKTVTDIDDFEQWLEYTAKWATNSKWADDATAVLTAMLRVKPMKFFIQNRKNLQDKIEGIIPYLERHMQRLDRLHTQTYLIDHVLDSTSIE